MFENEIYRAKVNNTDTFLMYANGMMSRYNNAMGVWYPMNLNSTSITGMRKSFPLIGKNLRYVTSLPNSGYVNQ